MKNAWIRFLSAALALMLCFALPAGLAEDAADVSEAPESASETAEISPDDVLMVVNGQAVTRAEVDNYLSGMIRYYSNQGYDMTDENNLAILNAMAVKSYIEEVLCAQKRADLGLELTDEERAQAALENAAEWAEIVDMYAQYYYGLTNESTEEETANARTQALSYLESMGYTESIMLESAIERQEFERIYAYMVQGVEVTDEDIQAAFEAHVAQDQAQYENDIGYYEFMTQYYGYPSYYTPAGYRGVTHILLEVDQELMKEWQSLSAKLEEQQDEVDAVDEAEEPAEAEEGAESEPAAEPVTQEQVDAAYAAIIASVQPTIDEIMRKVEEGTPFADLIMEYCTDPGMTGDESTRLNGYPVHMDSIVWDPAFVTGAFSVDEVGAVSAPVVGSYGVHIIQYTRDIPAGAVELTEELRATISDEVLSSKESERYNQIVDEWISEANIEYSAEAKALLDTFEGDAQ